MIGSCQCQLLNVTYSPLETDQLQILVLTLAAVCYLLLNFVQIWESQYHQTCQFRVIPTNEIVVKANERVNSILRSFVSGHVRLLVRAFTVYVRPIVEYNSIIWSQI